MRSLLAAVLLLSACSAPPAAPPAEAADDGDTVNTHELGDTPLEVIVPLGDFRDEALAIARDPQRTLVLRVEGIAVTKQPDIVYEVHLAGVDNEVGVLSFYGAEASSGQYVAAFPIDDAAMQILGTGARELRVIFTPKGKPAARARFARITLAEE